MNGKVIRFLKLYSTFGCCLQRTKCLINSWASSHSGERAAAVSWWRARCTECLPQELLLGSWLKPVGFPRGHCLACWAQPQQCWSLNLVLRPLTLSSLSPGEWSWVWRRSTVMVTLILSEGIHYFPHTEIICLQNCSFWKAMSINYFSALKISWSISCFSHFNFLKDFTGRSHVRWPAFVIKTV